MKVKLLLDDGRQHLMKDPEVVAWLRKCEAEIAKYMCGSSIMPELELEKMKYKREYEATFAGLHDEPVNSGPDDWLKKVAESGTMIAPKEYKDANTK